MPKCSYCGDEYDLHKGLTYILKSGVVKHLCSPKCRKNLLMKRRKVRWILKEKKTVKTDAGEVKAPAKIETKKKE